MKLSKKAMKRAQIILNTFVVLLMLIQPVGTPSLMLALAADEPTAEAVSTPAPDPVPDPAPAPKEEPKTEPTSSTQVELVAPTEEPAVEAPVVKETPVVTEDVADVTPAADPIPADEPTAETVSEDAPADVSTGETIGTEVQNQVDTITGAVTDEVPMDSAIADPSVQPEEGLITPEAAFTDVPAEAPAAPKETWSKDGDKATTNDPVEKDVTYVAPQNDQVTVTFTKLPDNPGTLSIEEITLSDEQVASLNALSNKAYDITSDMADGTFKYDLTLPKPKDEQNVQIKYAEDVSGLENADIVPSDDVKTETDSVSAKFDHFTVFTVTQYPTVSSDTTGIGTVTWSNPDHIYADDGSNATAVISQSPGGNITTHYLEGTNYGYAIPAGATINGITVSINRNGSATTGGKGIQDVEVRLIKSGTIVGDNKALVGIWSTTPSTVAIYGSGSDLWGTTWTPADINSANFGVAISVLNNDTVSARTARVDYINVTVKYTTDTTAPTIPGQIGWSTENPPAGSDYASGTDFADYKTCGQSLNYSPMTNLWGPSTDANGVAGYDREVYSPDSTTLVYSSSMSTNYINGGGAVDGTTYWVRVRAYDAAGNKSDWTPKCAITYNTAPVITAETSTGATDNSITITWTTDHPATSRVVYDTVSHSLGSAPNYGYAFSTTEDATLTTSHSVVVSPLTSGTTYYFRAISHGSPETVSSEIVGTTSAPDVTVTIVKYADSVPATAGNTNSTSFPMTSTWNAINIGAGSGDFSLGPVGFNNPNPYQATTSDMTNGADYSVVENIPTTCDGTNAYKLVGYSAGDTLSAAESATPSATAAFTGITSNKFVIIWNEKCLGSITIVKNTAGGDDTFNFDSNFGVSSLSTSGGTASQTVDNLAPGTDYNISETVPTGWDQNSATCDHGTIDAIEVLAGQTTTCTFTNTKRGSIEIKKIIDPSDSSYWNFGIDAGYTLWDTWKTDGYDSGQIGVAPGSHSVVEQTAPGTDGTQYVSILECKDGDTVVATGGPASLVYGQNLVSTGFNVASDQHIVCTFTNTKKGTIEIKKIISPSDTTNWNFGIDGGYTLWDTQKTDGYDSGQIGVAPGTHSVVEQVGYNGDPVNAFTDGTQYVSTLECKDGDTVIATGGPASLPYGENLASPEFNVASDQYIVCTFTNTKKGAITIVKNTAGGDDTFNFDSNFGVSSLSTSGGTASQTVDNLAPGTDYNISETVPTGWDQNSATCDHGTIDAIEVLAGQTTTCTFTNTKRGSISGYKWNDENGDGQWGGGEEGLTGWTIFIDEGEKNGVLDSGEPSDITDYYGSAPGYYSFGNLIPGNYSVCEEEQTGWSRTSPADSNCQDVTVDPGQTLSNIDFGNVQMGKIVVEKQTLPDGSAQSFEFTPNYAKGTFSLTDGQQNESEYLVPGTYSVSETALEGWDLTSADCVSGGSQIDRVVNIEQTDSISPDNINLNPGETVTCTFTNTKRGGITVVKNTLPSGSAQSFSFIPGGYNKDEPFSLTDTQENYSGLIVPGTYSVSEAVPDGWDLTNLVCVDIAGQNQVTDQIGALLSVTPDVTYDGSAATINLQPGEFVKCTYTDTQRGKITVKKVTTSDTVHTFTFIPSYGADFNLKDGESNSSALIVPGAYNVAEKGEGSWNVQSIVCTDAAQNSTFNVNVENVDINLAAGADVTCIFTNEHDKPGTNNNGGGGGGGGAVGAVISAVAGLLSPGGGGGGGTGGVGGQIAGATTNPTEETPGIVAGATTQCVSWPLWVWLLILGVYLVGFNLIDFLRLRETMHRTFFWQLIATVGAGAVWYFFDVCRNYVWFPLATLIVGALSYRYYLSKLRRLITGG